MTRDEKQTLRDRRWIRLMELGAACGCHQRADRSFFVAGYQLPVCARCLGAGLGQLAALPLAFVVPPRFAAAALALPLAVDGTTQRLGLRESTNKLRFATGLLAGYGLATAALAALAGLLRAAKK